TLERIDMDSNRESRSYMEKRENLKNVQEIFRKIHESGEYNSFAVDGLKPIAEIHEFIWSTCLKITEENGITG
ncbi:MAG: hypothetical protein ACTSU9_04940, partial [Promethearchaeota archaeon]